jgi:hypothetical protein
MGMGIVGVYIVSPAQIKERTITHDKISGFGYREMELSYDALVITNTNAKQPYWPYTDAAMAKPFDFTSAYPDALAVCYDLDPSDSITEKIHIKMGSIVTNDNPALYDVPFIVEIEVSCTQKMSVGNDALAYATISGETDLLQYSSGADFQIDSSCPILPESYSSIYSTAYAALNQSNRKPNTDNVLQHYYSKSVGDEVEITIKAVNTDAVLSAKVDMFIHHIRVLVPSQWTFAAPS